MKFSLPPNKKAYFASDLHLTLAPDETRRNREREFVRWLDAIEPDAGILFLLGDMFDYWFDFRYVVPRGGVQLLAKLQHIVDKGIPVHYFAGNHDLWMEDYFATELGVLVHRKPESWEIDGKRFLIGHGHNLGPVHWSERLLNAVFNSRVLRVPFVAIHPRWTVGFGLWWSRKNRQRHGWAAPFYGADKEYLAIYARERLRSEHFDYFIFGHRHLAMDIRLTADSRYLNIGEWVHHDVHAVFDSEGLRLASFRGNSSWLTVE